MGLRDLDPMGMGMGTGTGHRRGRANSPGPDVRALRGATAAAAGGTPRAAGLRDSALPGTVGLGSARAGAEESRGGVGPPPPPPTGGRDGGGGQGERRRRRCEERSRGRNFSAGSRACRGDKVCGGCGAPRAGKGGEGDGGGQRAPGPSGLELPGGVRASARRC